MASFVLLTGNQQGTQYPLGRRPNVIGRAESLLIQILDEQVSRKHLQIRYDRLAHKYFALDMHSRNGVFLNGMRLGLESALLEGDRIRLGNTELVFTDDDCDDGTLHRYKKAGEGSRKTSTPDNTRSSGQNRLSPPNPYSDMVFYREL